MLGISTATPTNEQLFYTQVTPIGEKKEVRYLPQFVHQT